ncbi:MAG TPA: winged helix-turn-helix domain-containing protein [Methanotrichaceae archaeon]|nr:winged helix-turn-helix domain-containing protein [Methanotrichaceae archaeon]HQI92384.1 winged helix-turn-helix domain-containing protein [Methanotrichaceae archaeon]
MRSSKVNLDLETIKALASEERISILQVLKLKSMNLTGIYQILGLPKSSTYRNLVILISSGLVDRIDKPNKWRYYRLTEKGRSLLSLDCKIILHPGITTNESIAAAANSGTPHGASPASD